MNKFLGRRLVSKPMFFVLLLRTQEDVDAGSINQTLQALDDDASKAKAEKLELLNKKSVLDNQVKALNEQMDDEQLKLALQTLRKENGERSVKLEKSKNAACGAKIIDKKELEALQKELSR